METETTGYLQFGIPELPYSAVRIPLVEDLGEQDAWVARAMNAAQLLANAYHEAFAEPFPESPPQQQPRPAPQQAPNGTAQRAPQTAPTGSGAYCPKHPNVEAIPSKELYAKYEEDEYGNQVQANFFCPGKENGTGTNHGLWRRELVWRGVASAQA